MDLWAYHHNERIDFSRPRKPTDNAFIETFNGSLRDEFLNLHWFDNLAKAKRSIEAWMNDYNVSRPHMGIGNMPPTEYALQVRLLEKIQVQTLPETNIEIGSSLPSASTMSKTNIQLDCLLGAGHS